MNITVSKEAAEWYKKELNLSDSSYIRFFARYGGFGGNIPGFSLGINNEAPKRIHTSTEVEHIIFYIDENDAWYFDDKDLNIHFNSERGEPEFSYE